MEKTLLYTVSGAASKNLLQKNVLSNEQMSGMFYACLMMSSTLLLKTIFH